MASFKVDMGGAKDKIRAICTNQDVGLYAASEVGRLSMPYVPRLEGALRDFAIASPFLVRYVVPYAHYQWEGKNIQRRTTPGTVSHWEEYISKAELARNLTEYLKGLQ